MKKPLFIFILAAVVALSSGLPLQAADHAMDSASDATMTMDDCADCVDCDENAAMPTCDNACLSACAAGVSLAVMGHPVLNEISPTALVYDSALRDRVIGALPAKDLPPPRS